MTKRKCRHCKTIKTLEYFDKYERGYGIAHRTVCKECTKILSDFDSYDCQVCKVSKPRQQFPISSTSIIGIERTCKKCKNAAYKLSNTYQTMLRDNKGRYKSDPEYRAKCIERSATQRSNFKERTMLSGARSRATRKGLEFNITLEDIVIPDVCPILESPIVVTNKKRMWDSASLDRVDNSKGYVKGNVRVISYLANHIKGIANPTELKAFSKNILPYINKMI